MNALARLAGASLLGLAALPATAANLIINGSFEDDIGIPLASFTADDPPNWELRESTSPWSTVSIEVQTSGVLGSFNAQDGNRYIELDGDGGNNGNSQIYQRFATNPNQLYKFSFWYSPRTAGANDNDAYVEFGLADAGNGVFGVDWFATTLKTANGTVGSWTLFEFLFTATGSESKVLFQDLSGDEGTLGALIDNVSVTAVPVPAAVWLLGSSMIGLVGVSRRRSV